MNKLTTKLKKHRLDFFLIWGHGLAFEKEILDMIKEEKSFELLKRYRYQVTNMRRFVKKCYSHDYAPFYHLKNKTRYLLTVPPEVVVILLRNNDVQESLSGNGAFRHLECERVKAVKENIRNRYNPKIDGKRSEDHVIHASDNEGQTDALLKLIGEKEGIKAILHKPHPFADFPPHLGNFKAFLIKEVPLNDLNCRIRGADGQHRLMPLAESPHRRFLDGDVSAYQKYIESLSQKKRSDFHTEDSFRELYQSLKYLAKPFECAYIVTERIEGQKGYIILDGLHRAAVLDKRGNDRCIVAVKENEA